MRAVFDLYQVDGGKVKFCWRRVKTHKVVGQYLKINGEKLKILGKQGRKLFVV